MEPCLGLTMNLNILRNCLKFRHLLNWRNFASNMKLIPNSYIITTCGMHAETLINPKYYDLEKEKICRVLKSFQNSRGFAYYALKILNPTDNRDDMIAIRAWFAQENFSIVSPLGLAKWRVKNGKS